MARLPEQDPQTHADTGAGFGQQVRARRRELDLTQEALSELANCSVESIKKIEAGRLRPSRPMAEALARALQIEPAQLTAFVQSARQPIRQEPESAQQHLRGVDTPNNLPQPPTPLIGREREVDAVVARLRDDGVRLITLTGVGGTGKTRLALEAATAMLGDFSDGVYFVNLAPLADPELVLTAVAATLDVREVPGQQLITGLSNAISDRRILLVLDNFEHLTSAAPQVAEMLASTTRLKVLATSRERLHLRGEKEFEVPPLLVPDLQHLAPLAELAQSEAIRLFVERAQDVVSGFQLTEANAASVAAICHRLDGLPLAIELAAPRIRVLTPPMLLSQLSSRFGVLTGGPADLPDRQRTLRNTISWSHNLLATPEQILFRRLGAFAGGCTLEAAEAVCGGQGAGESSGLGLLDGLTSLVDKHLLHQQEQTDGTPRFWMLETLREFALERLEESRETDAIRQRHATYYVTLVVCQTVFEG